MSIRELFSTRRPIDRPIEKVIDYYAVDEDRLAAEIEEYEVTDNLERCFERFVEVYGDGVRTGRVTETGIWVSGFYGSGKSSFTKYLGFALDGMMVVRGRPFLELLVERLQSASVIAATKTLAQKEPTAVVMLDLGAEQLADNAAETVARVLYWKVLQWAGYSRDKKLAELERTLEERGLFDRFRDLYRSKNSGEEWQKRHNDPLAGVARAALIIPELLPQEFPTPESFRTLRFEEALDLRELTKRMIDVVRKKSAKQNILFLIDEAGQYVAPRSELILNLDGFARNLKELGQGKVWIACTGQQTLAEIIERSAHNSAELNKLRDRFPIAINLEARDIREITYRRLLTKSSEGEQKLRDLFSRQGQALATHTRLTGTRLFSGDPDGESFVRLYPFLPQHFDLLLELIRNLARSTGGIGLRSAIRVIQDLLVDASRLLPSGATKIADRPVGKLACLDDFYTTLRADIAKVLPHVSQGVERVDRAFPDDALAQRIARAIAALQPLEGFPRTIENLAALIYPGIGEQSLVEPVRETLRKLVADRECGVIDDPQTGGFQFLSDGVRDLRGRRNTYTPKGIDIAHLRGKLLQQTFDPLPSAKLEDAKEVKAGIRLEKVSIAEPDADVQFQIENVDNKNFSERKTLRLADSAAQSELKNRILWLTTFPEELEDLIVEICRSDWLLQNTPERDADKDVAQFLRAERRQVEANRDRALKLLQKALMDGLFIFRGQSITPIECGQTLDAACRIEVKKAAEAIFPFFRLAPIRPQTDLAAKYLGVERLDRMPADVDPLRTVKIQGGRASVDVNHSALAEALRAFKQKVQEVGTGRLQGNAIQDFFAAPRYGWSKDATRYLFAALLVAGEIVVFSGGEEIKTSGPKARDVFKSSQTFNHAGIAIRDSRPSLEALETAASNLEKISGSEVFPLEDRIAAATRSLIPAIAERLSSLSERLRLLRLPGVERAQKLMETLIDLPKQDGAGAVGLLGAKDCSIPADVKWAEAVLKALESGAEDETRRARRILQEIPELEKHFPDEAAGLLPADEKTSIEEILASETFHEKIPAIRAAIRRVLDSVSVRFNENRIKLVEFRKRLRDNLEALPEWLLLSEEDRIDLIRAAQELDVPEKTETEHEITDLSLLLTRLSQSSTLRNRLLAEIRNRVPKPPEPRPGLPPEPQAEESVDIGDLVSAEPVRSEADLEAFLTNLKARIVSVLRRGAAARLKVR